jgi:hypothetical protein
MAPARSATAFANQSGPVSLEPRLRHKRCSGSDKHLSEEGEEILGRTLPYALEVFRVEVVCRQLSCQCDGRLDRFGPLTQPMQQGHLPHILPRARRSSSLSSST